MIVSAPISPEEYLEIIKDVLDKNPSLTINGIDPAFCRTPLKVLLLDGRHTNLFNSCVQFLLFFKPHWTKQERLTDIYDAILSYAGLKNVPLGLVFAAILSTGCKIQLLGEEYSALGRYVITPPERRS